MIEGLWIVQYEGTQGGGAGVAVFTQGGILGGDYGYTYEGNYAVKDGWIAASVHVANYLPNVESVLGFVGNLSLEFMAPMKENLIQGAMSLVGHPGVSIVAKLTKKANL